MIRKLNTSLRSVDGGLDTRSFQQKVTRITESQLKELMDNTKLIREIRDRHVIEIRVKEKYGRFAELETDDLFEFRMVYSMEDYDIGRFVSYSKEKGEYILNGRIPGIMFNAKPVMLDFYDKNSDLNYDVEMLEETIVPNYEDRHIYASGYFTLSYQFGTDGSNSTTSSLNMRDVPVERANEDRVLRVRIWGRGNGEESFIDLELVHPEIPVDLLPFLNLEGSKELVLSRDEYIADNNIVASLLPSPKAEDADRDINFSDYTPVYVSDTEDHIEPIATLNGHNLNIVGMGDHGSKPYSVFGITDGIGILALDMEEVYPIGRIYDNLKNGYDVTVNTPVVKPLFNNAEGSFVVGEKAYVSIDFKGYLPHLEDMVFHGDLHLVDTNNRKYTDIEPVSRTPLPNGEYLFSFIPKIPGPNEVKLASTKLGLIPGQFKFNVTRETKGYFMGKGKINSGYVTGANPTSLAFEELACFELGINYDRAQTSLYDLAPLKLTANLTNGETVELDYIIYNVGLNQSSGGSVKLYGVAYKDRVELIDATINASIGDDRVGDFKARKTNYPRPIPPGVEIPEDPHREYIGEVLETLKTMKTDWDSCEVEVLDTPTFTGDDRNVRVDISGAKIPFSIPKIDYTGIAGELRAFGNSVEYQYPLTNMGRKLKLVSEDGNTSFELIEYGKGRFTTTTIPNEVSGTFYITDGIEVIKNHPITISNIDPGREVKKYRYGDAELPEVDLDTDLSTLEPNVDEEDRDGDKVKVDVGEEMEFMLSIKTKGKTTMEIKELLPYCNTEGHITGLSKDDVNIVKVKSDNGISLDITPFEVTDFREEKSDVGSKYYIKVKSNGEGNVKVTYMVREPSSGFNLLIKDNPPAGSFHGDEFIPTGEESIDTEPPEFD